MALKKGFCTHCKGDERLRIFNVNKDAVNCYCQNCMAEMLPKEAIDNYSYLISHYLKKASKALFDSTQYFLAYQTFAHIIDLDESIKVAHFGRILSMVYLSTVRKSKVSFACMLHRQEAPKMFHYQETFNEYYHFLILLLDALDTYESRLKKKITTRGAFYDLDCVILYLKAVDEIRTYKEFIAIEAAFFLENNKEYTNKIVSRVGKSQKDYLRIFKEQYMTADGYTYIFHKFDRNGLPLVGIKDEKPKLDVKYKKLELYPKDNKKSKIKEEVFLNNLPLSRLVTVSWPIAIFLMAVTSGLIISSLIVPDTVAKVMLIVFAIVSLIVTLILIILHFGWKNRLKKKYYNGTNPFIFK